MNMQVRKDFKKAIHILSNIQLMLSFAVNISIKIVLGILTSNCLHLR